MKIVEVFAREILDSNGEPTVEAEVTLENGIKALGQVPSGTSVGKNEAYELRDNDPKSFFGRGVLKAINNVKTIIHDSLTGQDAYNQKKIDELLVELDGTQNKSRLGANAILGVSMAISRAAARSQKIPFYQYFGRLSDHSIFELPSPLILLIEGGKHGDWVTDIQEFFIIPQKEKYFSFKERLKVGAEIYQTLKKILRENNYSTSVGMEGGFCPKEIKSNEEAFDLIIQAVQDACYTLGDEAVLGIDVASSELFSDGNYTLKNERKNLNTHEWLEQLSKWQRKYSIFFIEDPFAQEEWESWTTFTQNFSQIQTVGDDLLTTTPKRIQKAIDLRAVKGLILKPNQIGTISETVDAIRLSQKQD